METYLNFRDSFSRKLGVEAEFLGETIQEVKKIWVVLFHVSTIDLQSAKNECLHISLMMTEKNYITYEISAVILYSIFSIDWSLYLSFEPHL